MAGKLKGLAPIIDPIGTVLHGGKEKKESAPPPAPVAMPSADDDAIQAAKRRQVVSSQARAGRASTILTGVGGGDETRLGG